MEIKKYIIEALFSRNLTREESNNSLYLEEFMPERLGRMLEKLLKEEHEDTYLHMDLNEWEFFPSKRRAMISVSAAHERDTLTATALFYVNLANGMVALQGVQSA